MSRTPLQKFLSDLFFGEGTAEKLETEKRCVRCKQPATFEDATEIERKEFGISGLCPTCQRDVFSPLKPED